jgi:hypothetical protein
MAKSFGATFEIFLAVSCRNSSLANSKPYLANSTDIDSGVTISFKASSGMKYLKLPSGHSMRALHNSSRSVGLEQVERSESACWKELRWDGTMSGVLSFVPNSRSC